MRSRLFYFVFVFVFVFCLSSRATLGAVFHVEPATGSGVANDTLEAVTELVRSSVGELGGHRVIGKRFEAEYVLKPHLMRLGNSLILTLKKYKKDQLIFSSQLKATQVEELDLIARRLTRSVVNRRPGQQRHPSE